MCKKKREKKPRGAAPEVSTKQQKRDGTAGTCQKRGYQRGGLRTQQRRNREERTILPIFWYCVGEEKIVILCCV